MSANDTGLSPVVLADPGKKRTRSKAQAMIVFLVWYEDHLSLTHLGTRWGRDLCSLSQAVNRPRKRAETDPGLAADLEKAREDLAQMHICQG